MHPYNWNAHVTSAALGCDEMLSAKRHCLTVCRVLVSKHTHKLYTEPLSFCRAGQITGQMSQVLQPNSLIADDLNFGIYNMNFYVHSLFNFQLSVSTPGVETNLDPLSERRA